MLDEQHPISEEEPEIGEPVDEQENTINTEQRSVALTINIHSWATPIFTLVALVIGLFGGYYARPLLDNRLKQSSQAAVAASQAGEIASEVQAAAEAPESAVSRQQMMDFLVSQTRHFKGDPNATVTLIEFSDFQ